jgi:hypothetical protein
MLDLFNMLLTLRVFICLQFNGLSLIIGYTEERLTRDGDRMALRCDINSTAGSSVLWLYTPGEAYKDVQHIYTDGRMLSGWPSRCNVTTDAISSTLVLLSVRPNDAGYYECSDDHDDGIFIRLRVKLTVSKGITSIKTAVYSTTELSKSSIPTNRQTAAWDKNATLITGAPGNLRLVSGDTASFSLANLNAFVTIGGIALVAIFVAIMLTAMLTVAFKKTCKRRNKSVQPTQDETDTDGYAVIQTTAIYAEQRHAPGSYSSSSQEDMNSPQDYEEIPATLSTFRAEYEIATDRNHHGNFNSALDYEEIPTTTTFHAEQGSVHDVYSVNDDGHGYLQRSAYLSAISYDELSPTSLPVIFPGPLNDRDAGGEGEYWPMVRDGYVEISRRPNVLSTVVYDVLQPKKESQGRRKKRIRMFRSNTTRLLIGGVVKKMEGEQDGLKRCK